MNKDEFLMIKIDFLKILLKNEGFSLLTGGKDRKKNAEFESELRFCSKCLFLRLSDKIRVQCF